MPQVPEERTVTRDDLLITVGGVAFLTWLITLGVAIGGYLAHDFTVTLMGGGVSVVAFGVVLIVNHLDRP